MTALGFHPRRSFTSALSCMRGGRGPSSASHPVAAKLTEALGGCLSGRTIRSSWDRYWCVLRLRTARL
jgi:hypothetical protein